MGRKRKILLDTNAIIYFLRGLEGFESIGDFKTFYFSFITEIELLAFKEDEKKNIIKKFLKKGKRIDIDNKIVSNAIVVRKDCRLKIPDAIVVASDKSIKADLFTSDEEIIKKIDFLEITNLQKPQE